MKKMYEAISAFIREEEGTELVEWALVAGLIIVVGAGIMTVIGSDVGTIFRALSGVTGDAAGR